MSIIIRSVDAALITYHVIPLSTHELDEYCSNLLNNIQIFLSLKTLLLFSYLVDFLLKAFLKFTMCIRDASGATGFYPNICCKK